VAFVGVANVPREERTVTVIVAGKVYVDPSERARMIEGHRRIVERAREHPGCLDISISPDPIEDGRVNVYEYWESREVLDAWRKIAPQPSVSVEMRSGEVLKHEVSSSGPPFG
jgi:quinol monooxygenase YgiN